MSGPEPEARARTRYMILNAVRIAGLALTLLGLAIARGAIGGPWALGVGLAALGLPAFFFAPRLLARRWKAADREGR